MSRVPSTEGKSRLGGVLTPVQREALQWAFLMDTLDKVRLLPDFKCYLAATPADEIHRLDEVVGLGWEVMAQPGGSLGQRMLSIASHLFNRGHAPVILIGTDTPALSPSFLQKALQLLNHDDLVFGPASDGGYYLIGMRNLVDVVFEDIDWGAETVLEKTLSVCNSNSLTYSLLDSLMDVDRPDDLLAAAEQCKEQMGMMPVPARTSRFLKFIEKDKLE